MRGKPTHVVPAYVLLRCTLCDARGVEKPEGITVPPHWSRNNECSHVWKQTNSKVRLIDGVPHRKRRGRWVPIPAEWFGHKLDKQTRNKRQANETVSKRSRKHS